MIKWFDKHRRYYLPVQSHGVLSTYQKIIVYSSWISLCLLLISIVIEIFGLTFHWLSTVQNYCIGIICSLVVVIVSSVIQFKTERARIIDNYLPALFQVVRLLQDAIALRDAGEAEKELIDILNDINKAFYKYEKYSDELFWFNHEKQEQYTRLNLNVIVLSCKIAVGPKKIGLQELVKTDKAKVSELIDSAIDFSKDYGEAYPKIFGVLRNGESESENA